jgi:small subunit ribosomal protein S6
MCHSIARSAGNLILQNGGVLRGITNWGISALPKPLRNKSGSSLLSPAALAEKSNPYSAQLSNKHTVGHYFIMRFDSSAKVQHTLRKTWASDPRLLRFSVVKMGEKLGEICEVGGKAEEWGHAVGSEGSTGIAFEEEQRRSERGTVMDAVMGLRGSRGGTMGDGDFKFST